MKNFKKNAHLESDIYNLFMNSLKAAMSTGEYSGEYVFPYIDNVRSEKVERATHN